MQANVYLQLSRRRALALLAIAGAQALSPALLPQLAFAEQQTPQAGKQQPKADGQRQNVASPPPFMAWHGATLAEHTAKRDTYLAQGYRFISLSVYGAITSPYYAAVMIKPESPMTQHDFPAMPAQQWQQTFDSEAALGYGPIILTATGSASNPLFAAVFEPQNPIPLTRHGLVLAGNGIDPSNTIQ